MWWHKLIRYWMKTDYSFFVLFNWFLIFITLVLFRLISGRPIDLIFAIVFSFASIPVSLLITAVFQKYSSGIEDVASIPALLPNDLKKGKLLRSDKVLVFFYAEWCPYYRRSFSN